MRDALHNGCFFSRTGGRDRRLPLAQLLLRHNADDDLVHRQTATALEDVDADHVTANRTDAARHLAERTGAVGQPDADDEGFHCENRTDEPSSRPSRPCDGSVNGQPGLVELLGHLV